ncbi:MAG: hypothetical protein DHS80DRAFT_33326 [Piptocephalis tieghemiana]|nr:MAG: hypothetical protein DHS80DRAFT_33326 [Piptocephalis tieghemiana]
MLLFAFHWALFALISYTFNETEAFKEQSNIPKGRWMPHFTDSVAANVPLVRPQKGFSPAFTDTVKATSHQVPTRSFGQDASKFRPDRKAGSILTPQLNTIIQPEKQVAPKAPPTFGEKAAAPKTPTFGEKVAAFKASSARNTQVSPKGTTFGDAQVASKGSVAGKEQVASKDSASGKDFSFADL